MLGTVTTTTGQSLSVHTYTAPPSGLDANTQIVELTDQLLIVDTQYAIPFATEAADYARTLDKPISRVYLSHAHPDHFFGTEAFGAPVYALQSVRDQLEAAGEAMRSRNKEVAGDVIPDALTLPDHTVVPGTETVSGVRLDFREISTAEAETTLVISAPDEGILIAQDIAYSNVHLFIAEGHPAEWDRAVADLQAQGFTTVLPGHGRPGGPEILQFVRDYLAVAQPLLATVDSGEALMRGLLTAFPNAEGTTLLDLQNSLLFPTS